MSGPRPAATSPDMTLRNAVHRRNHKERSQPTHRKKYGLLEKHKDYVLRAQDHHSKRDRLKRLREKAAMRNGDEFYFGMINGKTEGGVHVVDRGNTALEQDVVALLKTQDAGYLRAQLVKERKRLAALVSRIAPSIPTMRVEWLNEKQSRREALEEAGLLATAKSNGKGKARDVFEEAKERGGGARVGALGKKTVWVDDADQVRAYSGGAGSSSEELLDDMDEIDGDDNLSDAESGSDEDGGDEFEAAIAVGDHRKDELARQSSVKTAEKYLGYLVSELHARQQRIAALSTAANKLGIVRALMATKGKGVRKLPAAVDAVARGRVTKNGLALPGNEDSDEDEDEGITRSKHGATYRWSKERSR